MATTPNNTLDVLNIVFVLSSMDLPREAAYTVTIIGISTYLFSVACNLLLMLVIASSRSLHEPMYIFLCNLSINDIIGISAMLPRSIYDLIFKQGHTTFPPCFIQAWCLHMYGGTTLLIISVMAVDRYIAICYPLRYHTIMSKNTIISLIVSAWMTVFILVVILFVLTFRFPFCKNELSSYYCDNVTILKLTCATDTTLNNIYGLFITGFFHGTAIVSVVFSYTWILITCYKNNDSVSRSKAWHTCGTHLIVFLIYEISSSTVVLIHRFPNTPEAVRKIMGLVYVTVPNTLNPVIYGIKTKEVKSRVVFYWNFCCCCVKMTKNEHVNTIYPKNRAGIKTSVSRPRQDQNSEAPRLR